MSEAAGPSPAGYPVLEYQHLSLPRLEHGPGRARLVLPPTPRWVAAIMLVACAASLVSSAAITASFGYVVRRDGALRTPAGFVFVALLAATTVLMAAGTVVLAKWYARGSRTPPTLEFSDGAFVAVFPALLRTAMVRAPLQDVVRVSATEAPDPFGRQRVTVTVVLTPDCEVTRHFRSPEPGLAESIERAFAGAMASTSASVAAPPNCA